MLFLFIGYAEIQKWLVHCTHLCHRCFMLLRSNSRCYNSQLMCELGFRLFSFCLSCLDCNLWQIESFLCLSHLRHQWQGFIASCTYGLCSANLRQLHLRRSLCLVPTQMGDISRDLIPAFPHCSSLCVHL